MATIDTVVPNSLNYTDIKPQAIESDIKLCRFQPTSTVTGARANDTVKFLLSGNGLLDPYSTFLKFTVKCTFDVDAAAADGRQFPEYRFLDRSAHSFIQRMIIRSQGVELERIENYDVIAAMINDMIYAPEQGNVHSWEGFPGQEMQIPASSYSNTDPTQPHCKERDLFSQLINNGSSPILYPHLGEVCFSCRHQYPFNNAVPAIQGGGVNGPIDQVVFADMFVVNSIGGSAAVNGDHYRAGLPNGPPNDSNSRVFTSFGSHYKGCRIPGTVNTLGNGPVLIMDSTDTMTFCIPIYSGLLGILMPEKKLLPLSLLPLEVEIVFSPHALYSMGRQQDGVIQARAANTYGAVDEVANPYGNPGNRSYTITDFNLYGNVLTFEQEIHKTLEASVADHGLFIYCNSFHSAPTQLITGVNVPSVAQISLNLKSVNSVHTIFMYTAFEQVVHARKLHFVSHNIEKMWLQNGVQLIPQYAIEGHAGSSRGGEHYPFLLETLKAWNKGNDPAMDCALYSYNFCGDEPGGQFDGMMENQTTAANSAKALARLINRQSLVGRCQYGISLEGEEIGQERTMITGRKTQYPFLLQMKGTKVEDYPSYMFTFLRADFIVYIRPDMQIVTLGK